MPNLSRLLEQGSGGGELQATLSQGKNDHRRINLGMVFACRLLRQKN